MPQAVSTIMTGSQHKAKPGHPEVVVDINRGLLEKGQLDDIAHNLKHINDSPSVDGKSFRAWLVGQANDALKASPKADHVVVIAPDTNTHYRVVFN